MTDKLLAEVLTAYTDDLNRGIASREIYLAQETEKQDELQALLYLAERLKRTLVSVQPSAKFVQNLGCQLAAIGHGKTMRVVRDHWREIFVGAAAVGSAISVIGLVAYLVRNRAQVKTPIASTG
jgi:hypothetical protein